MIYNSDCIEWMRTQSGDIVYDPFAGTGTTLVVAQEMGLVGIGTELDVDYYNFIQERLIEVK